MACPPLSDNLEKEISEDSEILDKSNSVAEGSMTENTSCNVQSVAERIESSVLVALSRFVRWFKASKSTEPRNSLVENVRLGNEDPTKPLIRKLEEAPWGFPRLARYANSDESFMLYRRFGELFARALHGKQSELAELEEGLRDIDARQLAGGNEKNRLLMSRDGDMDEVNLYPGQSQTRQQLLDTIAQKLIGYSDLLLRAERLAGMKAASARDRTSVANFLHNGGGQVVERERQWILEKEDLVSLKSTREYAWLDNILEKGLLWCRCWPLVYIFCSKETRLKTGEGTVRYYSRERISRFATLIITTFIGVLLIVPVYLLWRLAVQGIISNNPEALSLLVLFTLFFSAVVSTFTKAKRHEILAASAGYCALLVVFLSNVNSSQ